MTFTENLTGAQARILATKTLLLATSRWRKLQAEKYPADPRNKPAAELLAFLAADPGNDLPDDLVAAVSGANGFKSAANETARVVGFHVHPSNLREFIEEVLDLIGECQDEISRVFSNQGGA